MNKSIDNLTTKKHQQDKLREIAEYRTSWERTRILATITVQPHIKKKMTPQALLPFEWDKKEQKKETEFVTKEEGKRRMEEALKRKGAR